MAYIRILIRIGYLVAKLLGENRHKHGRNDTVYNKECGLERIKQETRNSIWNLIH